MLSRLKRMRVVLLVTAAVAAAAWAAVWAGKAALSARAFRYASEYLDARGMNLAAGSCSASLFPPGIHLWDVEVEAGGGTIFKADALSASASIGPAFERRLVIRSVSASNAVLSLDGLRKLRGTFRAGGGPGGAQTAIHHGKVVLSDAFDVKLRGASLAGLADLLELPPCDVKGELGVEGKGGLLRAELVCEGARGGGSDSKPSASGAVSVQMKIEPAGENGLLKFGGNVAVARLQVEAGGNRYAYSGSVDLKGEADVERFSMLRLDGANLIVNDVAIRADAEASNLLSSPALEAGVTLLPATFGALARLFPDGMVPEEAKLEKDGEVEGWIKVGLSADDVAGMKLEGAVSVKRPRDGLGFLQYLKSGFEYQPPQREGHPKPPPIRVDPSSPEFVPLGDVPPLFIQALLIREDVTFLTHRGFDFGEMKDALVTDLLRGERARGASTITQQLAKNLFLTKEKTVVRKLAEAYCAAAIEATLSKDRILEIYLNVIEWGPGIFGLRPAARHYFGKDPCSLSLKETAFLVSIIPNPVFYHGYCAKGEVSEKWEEQLRALLDKMLAAGLTSAGQYDEAVAEKVKFAGCSFHDGHNGGADHEGRLPR